MNRSDNVSEHESARGIDLDHWRGRLERLWTRKLDEIIVLCQACGETTTTDESAAATPSTGRLTSRLDQAYRDLAEIADAVKRIDAGHFGLCAGCRHPMPPDWLEDEPQIGFCPDCSLKLVCWRPSAGAAVPAMRQPDTLRESVRH